MVNSSDKHTHPNRHLGAAVAAAALSALALAVTPLWAQGSSGSSGAGTGAAGSSSSSGAGAQNRAAGNAKADANAAKVDRSDSKLMADLAHANIAEIETGKMALEKSQNAEVKKFAQHMIDEHTTAQKELQTLADAKGVKLPDGTDLQHKALATAMKAMSGQTFDNQYMKRAGVNDHERTIQLLQKTQKEAKDPDVKALATKMLPTVQHHLTMAKETAAMTDKAGKSDKPNKAAKP
jgi:putative membrane protein